MRIINTKWNWAYGLANRSYTSRIVLHHAAAKTLSPAALHRLHLANGWSGIGYHFYVRKSGAIYRGRPIGKIGAHARGYNSTSIGICAEGNYQTEKEMPLKQEQALEWLVDRMKRRYPKAKVVKHGALNPTACPGRYYPFTRIKRGLTTGKVIKLPVPTRKPAWWKKVREWMKLV